MERLKNKTLVAFTAIFLTLFPGCTTSEKQPQPSPEPENRVLSSIRLAATRFRKIFKR